MGKGKADLSYWISPVISGQAFVEIRTAELKVLKKVLASINSIVSVKCFLTVKSLRWNL